MTRQTNIGVLALQGDFAEHVRMLQLAREKFQQKGVDYTVSEVRTVDQLAQCDALVIPGGESTAISLIAERTGMLEPLRKFVKVDKKPVWGTCAGMILLSERATKTSKGGQQLIGGLDVTVIRNHFGRQLESFTMPLKLPFLDDEPHSCVFIRAPIIQSLDASIEQETVEALKAGERGTPQVIASIPADQSKDGKETIVAVRQGNVVGMSFHPELTNDPRVHEWWLQECVAF